MSSRVNWLGKYMVNEQSFEEEVGIQRRVDQHRAFSGNVREGFVTSLFIADRWGGREGLSDFLATNWSDKLGDTFDALHEHYLDRSNGEYRLNMPKDYEELTRVARLFRETYTAYFIWWCMKDVQDGLAPTVWHDLATYVEEAEWLPDKYSFYEIDEKAEPEKFLAALWDDFFDRVYGRSRKFNFSNFVAANSIMSMLEERYWMKKGSEPDNKLKEDNDIRLAEEKRHYDETVKKVEDYLNGKNDSGEV